MIVAVEVERPLDDTHTRYLSHDENRKDCRWRCGRCLQGLIQPATGAKCSRCPATVKALKYDREDRPVWNGGDLW